MYFFENYPKDSSTFICVSGCGMFYGYNMKTKKATEKLYLELRDARSAVVDKSTRWTRDLS